MCGPRCLSSFRILVLLIFSTLGYSLPSGERILLENVKTITLTEGKLTTGRRNDPVPQLECEGYGCRKGWRPESIQCYNRGSDGVDVQWECKSDMPEGYSFGPTKVSCEGYSYRDDPYILRDSCQVIYSLRYNGNNQSNSIRKPSTVRFILLCIVVWLVFKLFSGEPRAQTVNGTNQGGGDGGGGFWGWPRRFFGGRPGMGGGFGNFYSTGPSAFDSASCQPPRQGVNPGAGFWTGLFTGGGLGYFFGNRNAAGERAYQRPIRRPNFSSQPTSYGSSRTRTVFSTTSRR